MALSIASAACAASSSATSRSRSRNMPGRRAVVGLDEADDVVAAPQRHREDRQDLAAEDRLARQLLLRVRGQHRRAIGEHAAQHRAARAHRIDRRRGAARCPGAARDTASANRSLSALGAQQDRDVGRARQQLERRRDAWPRSPRPARAARRAAAAPCRRAARRPGSPSIWSATAGRSMIEREAISRSPRSSSASSPIRTATRTGSCGLPSSRTSPSASAISQRAAASTGIRSPSRSIAEPLVERRSRNTKCSPTCVICAWSPDRWKSVSTTVLAGERPIVTVPPVATRDAMHALRRGAVAGSRERSRDNVAPGRPLLRVYTAHSFRDACRDPRKSSCLRSRRPGRATGPARVRARGHAATDDLRPARPGDAASSDAASSADDTGLVAGRRRRRRRRVELVRRARERCSTRPSVDAPIVFTGRGRRAAATPRPPGPTRSSRAGATCATS